MTAEAQVTHSVADSSASVKAAPVAEQGTNYVILEQSPAGWTVFAHETARSADTAVTAALEGNTDGGTFVAVPAKSWRPVKVTPQTVTTLKLEEAK